VDCTPEQLQEWLSAAEADLRAVAGGERPSWRHDAYVRGDAAGRAQLRARVGRGRLSTRTWSRIHDVVAGLRAHPDAAYVGEVLLPEATIAVHRALDPTLSSEGADELLTGAASRNVTRTIRAMQALMRKS
jgi:hypothetical protein